MPASKAQQAAAAARRKQLVAMRLAGVDFETIAEKLNYSSRQAASKDMCRTLEANIAEQRASVEVYRETELMRLDQLTVEVIRVLKARHYVVTQSGRLVDDPTTGNPMLDDGPVLAAVDRLLKIQDRRAKLLGLDAPQSVEVLTIDTIDAKIEELTHQLASFDSEAGETAGTATPAD